MRLQGPTVSPVKVLTLTAAACFMLLNGHCWAGGRYPMGLEPLREGVKE